MENDKYFMQLALQEACKGRHQTWKNPLVGAVIVKDNHVLAKGYHHHFGEQHAERDAISKLTPEQLFNSTLYVTLEPCNHFGKQPPCSQLIVNKHIKRVVIAQIDPHKLVTGKGIAALKENGIQVATGILTNEARKLNEHYTYFYETNQPWITVKQAISLDYKVAVRTNQRTKITNDLVYQKVHSERADYQAIVIGSSTAIIDNPSLLTNVHTDYSPIRIVLDRRGRLLKHLDLKLFTDQKAQTWIFTENKSLSSHPFNNKFVHCFFSKNDSIGAMINELKNQELQSIYVEGGPTLEKSFLDNYLVNELITYIAPDLLGANGVSAVSPSSFHHFSDVKIDKLNNNVRIDERRQNV
ncbi:MULTISPECIES: bifunctional diaminohydroxyphosphoribosylaminopyrimidine deaminase/5-amino-6-(5-phosphoribosylamino)uracil reductase RibD [Lactobacillus]|uniref:bifunctional diaminohydroxyphosphoribosylaminopyrimidine deaminase/5-amino-6-(5-phosphoribosylamino)uracil reductase RibD n=1 Tax=Lactobacillus TaxID=1578 RepID=UPI0024937F82|nr:MULTISPECIES: bifunctional diaminohydroxyphosphoribosylaminopyrimidine deaminase/5-amino-6-(5-phosphoribosylamino)uracil reductase RibD [Lactobacillus]